MCKMCDGTTYEQFAFDLRTKLAHFGWTSVYVEPERAGPAPGYGYSIGLIAHAHPELVLAAPPDVAAAVFGELAPQVRDGRTLLPGTTVGAAGLELDVVDVDDGRIRAGLLGIWGDVFPQCGHHAPVAVQLVARGTGAWAAEQPRFDGPRAVSRRVDRAELRRQARAANRPWRAT